MTFAVPFRYDFKYFDDKNIQININYKHSVKELTDFIASHKNFRINFIISEELTKDDYELIQILSSQYKNIVVCLPTYHTGIEELFNNYNIPHYYNEFVKDWDRFHGFLTLNITDIFISENLCFDLRNCSIQAKKANKRLRSYCNVCESSWEEGSSLKTFFIRPEDIELYSKYIDTFEFFPFNKRLDATRLNTLYKIYAKDQKWFGKLNEIIDGYEGDEDSRFIISKFAEARINCKKRCYSNNSCSICDRTIELGKVLKDKGIMVTVDKN